MSDIKYAYPLILNKVASPQYATATLRRQRLIDWLNAAANCRATVLAADAGYGKTTLLWQWEREVDFPCYWYKLDRNDRDWTFHISYLIEAIAKRHPGFGTRAHSMLQQLGGPGSSRPGVAAYLLAEMHERLTEPCTFIIDDWQYVNAVTEVRGLWNQILRDAPPTCRFVFSSRAKPKLQFARFKTHNGYAELRTDSLRFTPSETAALFRDIYKNPLEASELSELDRRTEGWAVSLQLIEFSLHQRTDPIQRQSFVDSIRGSSDPALFEFLAEEVLDQQPEDTRNFLLSTSILQQMTAEVAERLAGVHDGSQALTDLEHRGLFTHRLDDKRYRYHTLFREFLERQLIAERSQAEVIGLQIHAASYFETSENWPEAIHHYLRATLNRQAARLISRYGEDVTSEGRLGSVDEWLQQLPPEAIKSNARLSLLEGEALGIRGEWSLALAALQRARNYFSRKGDRRLEALACLKLSSVLSSYGDAEGSWKLAEDGLRLVPDEARVLRMRLEGDLALTGTLLTEGLEAVAAACKRIAVEAGSLHLDHYAAIALHNLGFMEIEMGRYSDAITHLERAGRFWSDLPGNPFADYSDLVRVLALVGDFELGHKLADAAIEKTRRWPRPHSEAIYGRGCLLAAQGRFEEAAAELRGPLDNPEILGTGRVMLGALMIDCIHLSGTNREDIGRVIEIVNRGPRDSRLELSRLVANAVASHTSKTCGGECQRLEPEIARWSALGMVTTTHGAAIRLATLAFEHRNGRAPERAVRVLERAAAAGVLGSNRWWIRRLSQQANQLGSVAKGGPEILATLVQMDPEGWRLAVVGAIADLKDGQRARLLGAVVRHANRETAEALRNVGGQDVAAAVRQLQLQQAPRIHLRTLGPLAVHRGTRSGPSIPIRKRRLRAMLGLLASHIDRPLTRDQVISALWPDADAISGDNSLNQTVFQLRRELDPAHREGESPPYVVSTPDSVSLNPELVQTDLQDLRRLALRIADGDRLRKPSRANEMVALVRGEFLMDLRYEDWCQALQLGVHSEVRSLLEPLVDADGVELTHEVGVRAAAALLTLDEYDDWAQLALVRHLTASGRRSAARTAARRYVQRARDELGEEPAPALVEAARDPDLRSTLD